MITGLTRLCNINTFFFQEALKNKAYDDATALALVDASNAGSPFMPAASSPLLSLASFDGENIEMSIPFCT